MEEKVCCEKKRCLDCENSEKIREKFSEEFSEFVITFMRANQPINNLILVTEFIKMAKTHACLIMKNSEQAIGFLTTILTQDFHEFHTQVSKALEEEEEKSNAS